MIESNAEFDNNGLLFAPITLKEQLNYTMQIYGYIVHSKRLYICRDKKAVLERNGINPLHLHLYRLKNGTFKLVYKE